MADLKRTDISMLTRLVEAQAAGMAVGRTCFARATVQRMIEARLVRFAPHSFKWDLLIAKAGREALRAATNPETKPS